MGEAIGSAVRDAWLEPFLHLAGDREAAVRRKQGLDEPGGIGGVEITQLNDAMHFFAVLFLDFLELFRGVHVDEASLFAISVSVGMKDRVERFVEIHVVQVRGDAAGDFFGGDDVFLRLNGEKL